MPRYFATVARGLEDLAARELEAFGAKSVRPTFAGVDFAGDKALLYRANLWSRFVFRFLVPVREFPCLDADALYREVQKLDWGTYLCPDDTIAVRATGGNKQLNHSHFTALQVKNALTDWQLQQTGRRSHVDTQDPDFFIHLHVERDRAVLSLDSSGGSLHRRGYRSAVGLAPLKETLAAALLEMSAWQPDLPFLDPLCGSGTLPLEASLRALDIAPGSFRKRFGFSKWQDFDARLWQQLQQEARQRRKSQLPAPIGAAIAIARF